MGSFVGSVEASERVRRVVGVRSASRRMKSVRG